MNHDQRPAGERARILDVGIGDPEAPANAIPNVLAHLIETETWRNSATVLVGLLLIGLGYWAYSGVRDSIARSEVAGLDSILATVVRGMDVWVNEHKSRAVRIAAEPHVVAGATRIALAARDGVAAACRLPVDLRGAIQPLLATSEQVAYIVIDREARIVATNLPIACGERVRAPPLRQRLDRALDGMPQFVRPHPDPQLVFETKDGVRRPLAWLLAPIQSGNVVAPAVLALGVLADLEFARLFPSPAPGWTTEAYAVADDGLLLTSPPFAAELVESSSHPGANNRSAVFVVRARDPGADAGGNVPELERDARPFTQAAALAFAARGLQAASDQRGMLAEPYRSYNGREVIGAWRWLPDYDIAVIAERSTQEAFAAMRYLQVSFAVIAGFIVLSLGAAFMSGVSLARLRRQFGRLQKLGAYTLERQLSEGGMATIYLARHALLKRRTAVKILKKAIGSDELIHRFEREVQLVSQLRHPNTVQIYDFGRTSEGQPYYVMEYLEGVTLTELVQYSGPVPAGRVIHILRQVAAALREAHRVGLVHRDVKPDNIMLCRRGEDDFVKLLDFGLVKDIESAQTRDVTKQLRILGTPRYMSPERIVNPADVDARSDLYALGAVAYFLLTGKHLFEGDDNLDITNQVLHAAAPRVSARVPSVPEALDSLIAACLNKDRAGRPPSADALIEALDRIASPLAWTQRDATAWWEAYADTKRSQSADSKTAS